MAKRQGRLPDGMAFKIITSILVRRPTTRQSDIVKELVKAGGAQMTAYRQVKRFFQQGRGGFLLPDMEQARVQMISSLEKEIDEGTANPAGVRLYGEAMGVVDPPSDEIDEPARLAAAAEAILTLRGQGKETDDGESS